MVLTTGSSAGSASLVPYRPSIEMHARLDGSAVVLPALESASRRATRRHDACSGSLWVRRSQNSALVLWGEGGALCNGIRLQEWCRCSSRLEFQGGLRFSITENKVERRAFSA